MAVHEAKFDDSGNGTATSEPMSDNLRASEFRLALVLALVE